MMIVKSGKRHRRYNSKKTKRVHTVAVLTPAQEHRIARVDNDRDRGLLTLLYHTGVRVGELVNLNYTDVFAPGLRTARETITVTGKGNKSRIVPLNRDARAAVRAIDRYNRRSLQVSGITGRTPLLISRNSRRLSIAMVEVITRREIDSHPHVLRHTALTRMKNAGVRLEVLQKIAGHESIETTAKYYLSVTTRELTEAAQAIETPKQPTLAVVALTA